MSAAPVAFSLLLLLLLLLVSFFPSFLLFLVTCLLVYLSVVMAENTGGCEITAVYVYPFLVAAIIIVIVIVVFVVIDSITDMCILKSTPPSLFLLI